MAHLRTCPKCGKKHSAELLSCFHCDYPYPRYQACAICGAESEQSRLVAKRVEWGYSEHKYYHPECLARVKQEVTAYVFTCAACGSKRSPTWRIEWKDTRCWSEDSLALEDTCQTCGHLDIRVASVEVRHDWSDHRLQSRTKCAQCYLLLFPRTSIRLEKDNSAGYGEFCHRACMHAYRRQRGQPQMAGCSKLIIVVFGLIGTLAAWLYMICWLQ